MEGLTFEPRPGLSIGPDPRDTTVSFWLAMANDSTRSDMERVSAFIVLLQKKAHLEVKLSDG